MKITRASKTFWGLVAASSGLLASEHAVAVRLSVHVFSPYQVSTGSVVSMGHAVTGSTDYNRLTAGGTYSAQCNHSSMLPTGGQRTESTSAFLGGLRMTVTIPDVLPAYIGMPGFSSLPRGTTVNCTYNWTARVVEGGYKIGAGGIGIGIGDGEAADGSTRQFTMRVPSLSDEDENSSCIP
jgi:hypothetical protein